MKVAGFVALLACVLAARQAPADETLTLTTGAAARPHAVYLDVLGKGGLWGLGYDGRLTPRLAVGGVASFYDLRGDRFLTFSPYLALYPIAGEHHGWFVHLGPQLVRRTTASPGPEWSGLTTTGLDGELGSGYEYRNHILLRAYVMATVANRVVPWIGASVGWTL